LDWVDLVALVVVTRSLLVFGVRIGALTEARHAGAVLRSFITSRPVDHFS
jgi:hypothetical protein